MHVCTTPGCPTIVERSGRCTRCRGQADRERRPDGNPYNTPGHHRFREEVLLRDPVCTQADYPDSDGRPCLELATVADHYPLGRRELVARGLDPNDPAHGRGLCKRHHDRATAQHQPGGWAAR